MTSKSKSDAGENEGIRKFLIFLQKIIDDNVIKNDVFQQKNERIMARKRRIWFPGAIYHLMHRGVRRTAIFEEKMDYQVMLKLLKVSLEKYNCKLHAYCLMTNHIHLLLETNDMEIFQNDNQESEIDIREGRK